MIPLVITAVRRALVGFLEPPSVGGSGGVLLWEERVEPRTHGWISVFRRRAESWRRRGASVR